MEGRGFWVFTAVQVVAVLILLWLLATWKAPWDVQRYVGTLLVVVGVFCIGVARYQLGRSFSIKPEAKQLVTHGLYSKIRNPIYVFGVVMILGFILVMRKPVLWIILVVVIVGQMIRARREARVLEAAFGDAYREYRRKTWF
ncbi:MAG: isoprenylcysteine carboxylmethyltransferase family protein [Acidobacteriia bacterium]|nr:isoprenylcysteine carboxylmethyltransferase family protein [Terriglobia bacterium]